MQKAAECCMCIEMLLIRDNFKPLVSCNILFSIQLSVQVDKQNPSYVFGVFRKQDLFDSSSIRENDFYRALTAYVLQ